MKIIVNENQFKRLILKEQSNDEGGEDHFLRHKTAVDYDATVPMEWKKCSADIKNHDGPVLLFFSRNYCYPCKKLKKMMDSNEKFQKWAHDNNLVGLYIYCETPYWVSDKDDDQKCRTTKCSDGKTLNQDLEELTEKFGGTTGGSGLAPEPDDPDYNKWGGVPKLFITDSSFNKKNEINVDSNINNLIKSLGKAI